ncbi:MAG TPA: glycosyltransferase family 39 protein [Aggregatilineales bacterium]|nr:glycosyltransferase family 39 protein [Aggregatilineales bacterium]
MAQHSQKRQLILLCAFLLFILVGLLWIIAPSRSLAIFPSIGGVPPTPKDSWYPSILKRLQILGGLTIAVSIIGILLRERIWHYLSSTWQELFQTAKRGIVLLRDSMRQEDRWHLVALALLLGIAFVFRLVVLVRLPFTNDEARSFNDFASQPLYVLISAYSTTNNHVFMNLLVHFIYGIFGNEVWIIRLPSFIAGVLTVPAVYIATRRLYNKNAALLAVAFVTPLGFLAEYGALARGYAIITFVFLVILILATYLINGRNPALWLIFIVLSALGLYTIPVMLYPFGIVALWLGTSIIVEGKDRKGSILELMKAMIAIGMLTLFLYAPVLLISGIHALIANPWVSPMRWSDFIAQVGPFLISVWNAATGGFPAILVALTLVGFGASFLFHTKISPYKAPLGVIGIIWCAVVLFAERGIIGERIWLFTLPFYYLLCAAGLAYLISLIAHSSPRTVISTAILGVLIAVVFSVEYVGQSAENDGPSAPEKVALFLLNTFRPGDIIESQFPTRPLSIYYFEKHGGSRNYFNARYANVADVLEAAERLLVIVDAQYAPVTAAVPAKYADGTPVTPYLLFEYDHWQVYTVQKQPIQTF